MEVHSSKKGRDSEVNYMQACHFAFRSFQICLFPRLWILCHKEAFSLSFEDNGVKAQGGFVGCLVNCNKCFLETFPK